MRALIVCDNHGPFPQPLVERVPVCLLPVGGKPLLFHMIERLVVGGVRHITLAVADQADYVRAMLDDGGRFGASLNYLPVRDGLHLGGVLCQLCPDLEDDLLVVPGLTIADADAAELAATRTQAGGSVALHWPEAGGRPAPEVRVYAPADLARQRGSATLPAAKTMRAPGEALLVWDMDSLREANDRFLRGLAPFAADTSHRRGHNCRVHPRASIVEPVVLGQDVEIGAGCRIGPLAVIGDNCIVDDGVEIRNSIVLHGTFAGRNTTLDRNLACQELLVGLDDSSCLHVPDPFILGAASAVSLSAFASTLAQRVIAAFLLTAGLPALAGLALRGLVRPRSWRKRTVAVGRGLASLDGQWTPRLETLRGFDTDIPLLALLPALWDVVRGAVNLVGVEPLSRDRTAELSGGFAEARFSCPAGLLQPWDAQPGPRPDDMERRVMEVFYARTRSFKGDMRLAACALAELAFRPAARV